MIKPRPNSLAPEQVDQALQTFINLCRTTSFTEAGNFIRRLEATDQSAPAQLRGKLESAQINPSEVPLYQGLIDSL